MADPRCRCVNVQMGSYANQDVLTPPWGGRVGIDRCVRAEVESLWATGIRTLESCCGHNKASGYIAVIQEHEPAMEARGYQRDPAAPHVFQLLASAPSGA